MWCHAYLKMAALARYCTCGVSIAASVTRYISLVPSSAKQASSNASQQEIFSEKMKSLWPQSTELDPRDVPHTRAGIGRSGAAALSELPIVHVKATFNNTIITITDHKGCTLAWTSAGTEGFKNHRKGTSFAAQSAGTSAGQKASALGINRVKVQLKGMGPGRQHSLKGLEAAGIDVAVIQDVTPIPHNGCKPKKTRRL